MLALNDFHGNLEPPSGSSGRIDGVDAGGAEFLATALRLLAEEVQRPDTITVAAGDLIGASPLLSAAFHDEPTIEALGLTGLDLASVGNHEFDEGADELLRMQNGGCHPQDGCADPARPYEGAAFQYLSPTRSSPPRASRCYRIRVRDVQGVQIGFIGMTLEGAPDIVTHAGSPDSCSATRPRRQTGTPNRIQAGRTPRPALAFRPYGPPPACLCPCGLCDHMH